MFGLIGDLLWRNLKLALSAIRRPREAPAWLMAALRDVAGREEFWWPMEAVPRHVSLRDTRECLMMEWVTFETTDQSRLATDGAARQRPCRSRTSHHRYETVCSRAGRSYVLAPRVQRV